MINDLPKAATVTLRVHRYSRDRFGDKTSSNKHDSPGWVLSPTASDEDTQHRGDQVTTRATAYGPPGVDVTAADEVATPDGLVWQVNGAPLRYTDPWHDGPSLDSTVLYLERTTG